MDRKQFVPYIPWIAMVVIIVVAGYFIYHPPAKPTAIPALSNLTVGASPTAPAPSPSGFQEPEVDSWKLFSNDQYNFSIQVPSNWYEQDYTSSPPRAGHIFAFSPNQLPCGTCSYVRDGYFSLRVYDKNTYPDQYTLFQQELQAAGRDPSVQPVSVGGKTGIIYANTVSVENNGVVYEFNLDINNGNTPLTDSKIIQKAATSISFTNLQFGQ